jgi:toxin ParE1/3/4
MSRPVIFSPRAEAQLEALHRYIAEHSGEARADAFVGRVLDACHKLDLFPERGTRRDDLFPGLRVIGLRRQATIAFTVEKDRVVIQGVLGRGRDLDRAFRKKSD